MTDDAHPSEALAAGDPRAILLSPDAPGPRPWYRGRGALLAGVVVVLLAITVATDLPTTSSHAANVAGATAFVSEVRSDVAVCALAVSQSIEIRRAQLDHSLTAADRATIPNLLYDNERGCTADNPLIDDLLNIDEPGTSVHTALSDMYDAVVIWTADGLKVVTAVQAAYDAPSSTADAATLSSVVGALDVQRAEALAQLDHATSSLHAALGGIGLPEVTAPS